MFYDFIEFTFNHNGCSTQSMHENCYRSIVIFQVIFKNNFFLLMFLLLIKGSVLPPHLSPFVEEKEGDYVPPERFGQRKPEYDTEEQTTKEGIFNIN